MGPEFKLRNANMRIFKTLYSVGDVIGKGAFSEVVLVTEKRGERRKMACKILDICLRGEPLQEGQTTLEQAEAEMQLLLTFDHPNILSLYDVFFDMPNSKCYMVTALSRGGNLEESINDRGSFSEDDCKTIMDGILRGVAHMHERGVAHRDLKPANVLIVDDLDATTVQLADFGMAKKLSPNSEHTVCGSPMYIAPEIIVRLSPSQYDTKADIWSCGVILYRILSGSPPFDCKTIGKLFSKIRKGEYYFSDPVWEFVSSEAKDLITKMMEVDPEKRVSANVARRHPWFLSS